MNASRFLFGEDLGRPAQERRVAAERAEASERAAKAVAEAERAAYARGVAAGREEAVRELDRMRAAALGRVAEGTAAALAGLDARAAAVEADALAFGEALARKLAGRALARQPLGPILEAAAEAFRHLRGVPHLAARVNPALVEAIDEDFRKLARERGFEGRVIVIGDDEMPVGDARLDWADGGVAVERRALEDAVEAVLARLHGPDVADARGRET